MRFPKRCPIPSHRGRKNCCGRGEVSARGPISQPKWRYVGPGIRKYPDGHVERTPAALRREKDRRLERGDTCVGCHEPFDDCREVELSHWESKGSGGWKRNDADDNLCLAHKALNRDCGSMDLRVYLREKYKPEICRSGI